MAITDLTGYTCELNENADIYTPTYGGDAVIYSINFVSKNNNYTSFEFAGGGKNYAYLSYSNQQSNNAATYYRGTITWSDQDYRTIQITGGTDATNATLIAWLEANGTLIAPSPQPSISIGTSALTKAFLGTTEVSAIWLGNVKLYEGTPAPSVDPILANNSWAVIKQVCESGQASNYWAVGDTKTDLGTDGNTRTFRISDMQGLYNKHCVFEQVELVGNTLVWNSSGNRDNDNCYNNWDISNMRNTVLPAMLLNFSSDLQAIITDTTIKTAKNGNSTTLVDTTQKLFLPAEKEIWASNTYSRTEEFSALTTWSYYTTHTSIADHIKYDTTSTARSYWLRSPNSGYLHSVCTVYTSGTADNYDANNTLRPAPCFSL